MADRTALVTGSTRNIGRGIALLLAEAGVTVAVNGRDNVEVDATVRAIQEAGGHALAAAGDVSDQTAVERLVGRILEQRPVVDILVSNAVDRAFGGVTDLDLHDFHRSMDVVVDGALHCVRAVVPGMRDRGWGRIVTIAGLTGQRGAAGHLVTATTKSGLIGMSKSLAHELGPSGITVNVVSPGVIDTDRPAVRGDPEGAREHYRRVEEAVKQIPLGRMGTIREVAAVTAFLCSDDAGFVSGQVVGVNGGAYT